MAVEGVMVSYNYSEGDRDQANIITVSASGIKFSNRWVLTHGSILSPLPQAQAISKSKGKPILNEQFYVNLPEIYVTCEGSPGELQRHYDGVVSLARRRAGDDTEHSSYQVQVLTGQICHVWQCPILDRCVDDILYSWSIGHRDGDAEKQTQLGKTLLSVFVLVDLESEMRGQKPLRPLSELFDIVRPPPGRGSSLEVHSTPFGCEVFLNAVTRGSVCSVVGKRPSLLLTDAATALGSEGGPVFTEGDKPLGRDSTKAEMCGDVEYLYGALEAEMKELVGLVVCSVSWWRGEWVGLTLAAPLVSVLAAKLRVAAPEPERAPTLYREILRRVDSTTVLVRCGAAWGAGVYLGGGYVATAAHVVANHATVKVSIYCLGVKETAIVRYKSADEKAYDIALLYSNAENWAHLSRAHFAKDVAKKGEPVLAAGYPYFNENNLADLRPTVTNGHVNNVSPTMIQTSCCVQSGFSGGAIYRLCGGHHSLRIEVVGVIVCNAKTDSGACYPYINMAIPAHAFTELFYNYIQDKDENKLRSLEHKKDMVQSQWRLLPYRSKI